MSVATSLIASFLIGTNADCTVSDFYINNEKIIVLTNNEQSTQNKSVLDIEYKKLIKKLYTYKELPNNWDGYNGVAPSREIIETAENFLKILKNSQIMNPKIMVSCDGAIGLFWQDNHNYLEVDIESAEYLSFFYEFQKKVYGEDDILFEDKVPEKLLSAIKIFNNGINTSTSRQEFIHSATAIKSSTKSFIKSA